MEVTQTFVVTDTGMTVRAGTVCDVMRGNDAPGTGNIHVRFSHPEPPWVVLVSRLYAMSADLQARPCLLVYFFVAVLFFRVPLFFFVPW